MASLDWSECPAVENVADRRSGPWVFRDTRMPVAIEQGAPSSIADSLSGHEVREPHGSDSFIRREQRFSGDSNRITNRL
jgi:hypothetical protein